MKRRVALLALAGALVSARAHGDAYPWLPFGDSDLYLVADPRLEVDLQRELVRRAKKTIDIITYDQRADAEVAMPLATALRDAADRGVRVRFMVSWNSQVLFDYSNRFGHQLIDPPTRVPIEYMIVGGTRGEDEGWGLLDGIHEKFFVVDGQYALTTGRGMGLNYLYWLDTTFALRGPLVGHIAHCFEAIWRVARRFHEPFRGYLGGPQRRTAPRYTSTLPPDAGVDRAVAAVMAWFAAGPEPSPRGRARLLHHDFLRQIHAYTPTPVEVRVDERLAHLRDPVVDALVARLRTARRVRIASVSAILHPALHDALVQAARRGAEVTVFINTAAPRFDRARKPVQPGGSVWAMEVGDLDDLLAAGARVYGFQIRPGSPFVFLHRKLAILDDVVLIGSHNMNVPSTAFFDEASIEIESGVLAAQLARLFDDDLARNGEPLSRAVTRPAREEVGARLLRWLSSPYLGYM